MCALSLQVAPNPSSYSPSILQSLQLLLLLSVQVLRLQNGLENGQHRDTATPDGRTKSPARSEQRDTGSEDPRRSPWHPCTLLGHPAFPLGNPQNRLQQGACRARELCGPPCAGKYKAILLSGDSSCPCHPEGISLETESAARRRGQQLDEPGLWVSLCKVSCR